MSLNEIIGGGCGGLILLLSLIQISPIKVNPWSAIFRAIGRATTASISAEIKDVRSDLIAVSNQINNVRDNVTAMQKQIKEDKAVNCRVRILRFSDEIYRNQKHSKEHFDQILEDITQYNLYCDCHPSFKNEMTIIASDTIIKTYRKCLDEHSFL